MSKDLKDLINSIEEETKSQAELEQTIHSLKEELNRLEFTIKEQKTLIENLQGQMKDEKIEQIELPSEVNLLKDIITSQRKDLEEKNNIIDNLNDQILEFNKEIKNNGDFNSNIEVHEEFIQAQKLILQLTDENELYKEKIAHLQNLIDEIKSHEEKINDFSDDGTKVKENEELVNFKKLNFQLMQENGLLRVEIETLKAKLQEKIEEIHSEDLTLAYETIDKLTSELEDYESQIHYLQEQLKNTSELVTISTEEALEFSKLREEFDNLKFELNKYQQENTMLQENLNEFKKRNEALESVKVYSTSKFQEMPKKLKHTLFNRMYFLLDEDNRNKIIALLIKDLKSENSETKRNAIKILSQINNNKVYDAFLEMIDDRDWLVRYNLIKALNQFENKSERFKGLLKKLSKDVDVDVRELAVRILNNFPE
ncbi:MAG: HEAT repeat domain-containing protein [Promethearchaeota archaeon]